MPRERRRYIWGERWTGVGRVKEKEKTVADALAIVREAEEADEVWGRRLTEAGAGFLRASRVCTRQTGTGDPRQMENARARGREREQGGRVRANLRSGSCRV